MKTLRTITVGAMMLGLAGTAHAQTPRDGWYIGLGLAPAWLDTDIHFTDGSSMSPDLNTAFLISGTAGYRWDGWRFEVEPFWSEAHMDTTTVKGPLAVNPLIATPSTKAHIDGHITVDGALFNAAYDFPIDEHFSFTAGGGIGWTNVSPSASIDNVSVVDHDESAFAWQVILGFIYALNRNLEFQVDYRYSGIDDTHHHSQLPVVNPLSTTPATLGVSERNTNLQAVMFSMRWYP